MVRTVVAISVELRVRAMAGAWAAVLSIEDAWSRAWALARLLPLLPASEAGDAAVPAMRASLALHHDSELVTVLVSLAPHVPVALRAEAIGAALIAATSPTNQHMQQSLEKLAPYLSAVQLDSALSCAMAMANDRGRTLDALAPYLSTAQMDLALACADRLSGNGRGLTLAALLRYASPQQRAIWCDTALTAALTLFGDLATAHALAQLAPLLSPEQLQRARAAAARLHEDDLARVTALTSLIPNMPAQRDDLIEAVLATAAGAASHSRRALMLRAVVEYLSTQRRAELMTAFLSQLVAVPVKPDIDDIDDRVAALDVLGTLLAAHAATAAAATLFDWIVVMPDQLGRWLPKLATYLPNDRLDAAVAAAGMLPNWHDQAAALSALAPRLAPQQIHTAWATATAMPDEMLAVRTMVELAQRLPPDDRAAAITTTLTYVCQTIAEYPAEPFLQIAPHLDERQRAVAISAAEELEDPKDRAWALTALAT